MAISGAKADFAETREARLVRVCVWGVTVSAVGLLGAESLALIRVTVVAALAGVVFLVVDFFALVATELLPI